MLLSQIKPCDNIPVALGICAAQISKMPATLADQLEQATSGSLIVSMQFQMLRERVDTLREKRNLHLG
jgi:hypothetical protein